MNVADIGLGGGRLLQIANRTLTQMMSYIIDCPDGGVVVIDGGNYCRVDAENLYRLLEERKKGWFMVYNPCPFGPFRGNALSYGK